MEDKDYKNQKAVALSYQVEDEAPKVIASGRGHIAQNIIQKAQEANVPLHEDEKLADSLLQLEIGENIPPELYQVVAEILVFVDDMNQIKEKVMRRPNE